MHVYMLILLISYSKQFEGDNVLIPRETSWFGYYPDGAFKPVIRPQEVQYFSPAKVHFLNL